MGDDGAELQLKRAMTDDTAAGVREAEGQSPAVRETEHETVGSGKDHGLANAGDVDMAVDVDGVVGVIGPQGELVAGAPQELAIHVNFTNAGQGLEHSSRHVRKARESCAARFCHKSARLRRQSCISKRAPARIVLPERSEMSAQVGKTLENEQPARPVAKLLVLQPPGP